MHGRLAEAAGGSELPLLPRQRLAGIALAAGRGTRLGEVTRRTPKPLLEVGGVTLLDLALERLAAVTTDVAVNAHHLAEQIAAHVGDRVHLSVESELLGTAGALANLRDWIGERDLVVTNADAWVWPNPLPGLLEGWSGEIIRLSVVRDPLRPDFRGGWRYSGSCLLPSSVVATIPIGPGGLYEVVWGPRLGSDAIEFREHVGTFFDCGTPPELAAAENASAKQRGYHPER